MSELTGKDGWSSTYLTAELEITAPGSYTATVTDVSVGGYTWNQALTTGSFTLD